MSSCNWGAQPAMLQHQHIFRSQAAVPLRWAHIHRHGPEPLGMPAGDRRSDLQHPRHAHDLHRRRSRSPVRKSPSDTALSHCPGVWLSPDLCPKGAPGRLCPTHRAAALSPLCVRAPGASTYTRTRCARWRTRVRACDPSRSFAQAVSLTEGVPLRHHDADGVRALPCRARAGAPDRRAPVCQDGCQSRRIQLQL